MIIEGVIICVNYGDFLCWTLPHNRAHFNKLIVVTDENDVFTKKVCDFYDVECLQTNVFYENDSKFNKGAGINAGLDKLTQADWVIHLDADIFLFKQTRELLKRKILNKECIYGVDRLMCNSFDDYINFLSNPQPYYEANNYFKLGARILKYKDEGYLPIGFFQMWNPIVSEITEYPYNHDAADLTDLLFSLKWNRGKRMLIPDFYVLHLDSIKNKKMGANWYGRKTPVFGYSKMNALDQSDKYEI